MLIQFRIGNYRSFRDPATFSFVAAPLVAPDKSVDVANTFEVGPNNLRLLRAAALYGANASGKSNLVKSAAPHEATGCWIRTIELDCQPRRNRGVCFDGGHH